MWNFEMKAAWHSQSPAAKGQTPLTLFADLRTAWLENADDVCGPYQKLLMCYKDAVYQQI